MRRGLCPGARKQAALEQARVAYEATVLAALKDVEDALVACKATANGYSACRPQPMPPTPHCWRNSATPAA
jgi:hypothetical protein